MKQMQDGDATSGVVPGLVLPLNLKVEEAGIAAALGSEPAEAPAPSAWMVFLRFPENQHTDAASTDKSGSRVAPRAAPRYIGWIRLDANSLTSLFCLPTYTQIASRDEVVKQSDLAFGLHRLSFKGMPS
jgi:hypothetical protein